MMTIKIRNAGLFTFFLCAVAVLKAESIDQLLEQVEESRELYRKTIDESSGIMLLYSRKDLERMQIRKLKDLLKSVRFFTYEEGVLGESILVPSGDNNSLSSMFRLYIDGHEVSSPIFGSAMLQFGEMDLGFVDHIEIYQGGNAIAFGNEPGLVTIRLYSKDPRREGGSTVSVSADTVGGSRAETCLSGVTGGGESLLFYTAVDWDKRKHVRIDGYDYSRDTHSYTIYGKFDPSDRVRLTGGYFGRDKDAFAGVGILHHPENPTDILWNHGYLDLTVNLPWQTVLELSADRSSHRIRLNDAGGAMLLPYPLPFTSFEGRFEESVYKALLHGEISQKSGAFKWGAEWTRKSYRIESMEFDHHRFQPQFGPNRLDIVSLYGEERYNFTPSDLIIGSVKYDHYSDNDGHDHGEKILRLGWIHLFSLDHSFKLFYNQNYLYPGFAYTSTYPNFFIANPDLDPERFRNVNGEWRIRRGPHEIKAGGAWQRAEDSIVIDASRRFVNARSTFETAKFYVDYRYDFDADNRIELEFYKGRFFQSGAQENSPMTGGYLRSYNRFGTWELYNELLYRQGYSYRPYLGPGPEIRVRNGWDYTVALRWHPNRNLTWSLKGENLLNRAIETPIFGLGAVPVTDRKITLSMEYFF